MNYVVGFLFDSDFSHVVLLKKTSPEWQRGQMNGPGGKIEQGELPEEAMSREFWEETRIMTDRTSWDLLCKLKGDDYELHVFYMTVPRLVNCYHFTEHTSEPVGIYDANELPENTLESVKWMIPLIKCRDRQKNRYTVTVY